MVNTIITSRNCICRHLRLETEEDPSKINIQSVREVSPSKTSLKTSNVFFFTLSCLHYPFYIILFTLSSLHYPFYIILFTLSSLSQIKPFLFLADVTCDVHCPFFALVTTVLRRSITRCFSRSCATCVSRPTM